MKHKGYILLQIALLAGLIARAKQVETVDGFQNATTSSNYSNTSPKEYKGGQTTWYVTNGTATGIQAVTNKLGYGQIAIGLQYNGSNEVQRGILKSDYIEGLTGLSCTIFATHGSVRGAWEYSQDGNTWKKMHEYTAAMTSPFTSNVTIPPAVLSAKGVYIRLSITNVNDNRDRIYVDDIRMVTEVEDECENCFPITL